MFRKEVFHHVMRACGWSSLLYPAKREELFEFGAQRLAVSVARLANLIGKYARKVWLKKYFEVEQSIFNRQFDPLENKLIHEECDAI